MLRFAYVIDIDNTVKPIFGHQEGAELGYNPQKPGRPSHNYHTFFIGSDFKIKRTGLAKELFSSPTRRSWT